MKWIFKIMSEVKFYFYTYYKNNNIVPCPVLYRRWLALRAACQRYKQRCREKGLIDEYISILKKYKRPYIKVNGITKIGDVVHKIEINGIEIKSRDPLFIKESENGRV